jgi:putative SOS response-associated peptidase YedK
MQPEIEEAIWQMVPLWATSFGADITHLRAVYPELTTFEAWLAQHRQAVIA